MITNKLLKYKQIVVVVMSIVFLQTVNAQTYSPIGKWAWADNSGIVHYITISSIEGGISIAIQQGQNLVLFNSGINQYANNQIGFVCTQQDPATILYGNRNLNQVYTYTKVEESSYQQDNSSGQQYRSQRQASISDAGDVLAQHMRIREQQMGNFPGQARSRTSYSSGNTGSPNDNNQLYTVTAVSENKTIQQSIPKSDIDKNIPVNASDNTKSFAVIIGNEDYKNEIKVDYAKNDARTFKDYVIKTLGVPEQQVHLKENATFGDMLGEIEWLTNVGKAFGSNAKLIFYYAGHGMPDEASKSSYLLPVDGRSSQMRTAVKVDELYASLTQYPVKQATVFLDACFSGAAREGMLTSGRGVVIKPKENILSGNLVVFSAVSGEQTAHPYAEKYHGLFTYFLVKKLQETKGNVSFQELSNYIATNVNQISVVKGKEQTPKVNLSNDVLSNWMNFKLK